jgi:type II thyroxine 5'-deiodinase
MFEKYKARAAFLFVYIEEAHPADGWQMKVNETEGVIIKRPKKWKDRQRAARQCCRKLNLSIPCVVDTIDDSVDDLYAGWPERIFVVDRTGTIAYAGKRGPFGFKPEAAETELRKLIGSVRP